MRLILGLISEGMLTLLNRYNYLNILAKDSQDLLVSSEIGDWSISKLDYTKKE